MYKYITLILIMAAFSSCSKLQDDFVNPVNGKNETINDGSGTYNINLTITDQEVMTSVKDDTLFLDYHEKVSLLLNPKDYENSSAVHFKEDFSKSSLAGYHYRMLNNENKYIYDSADDNLNNVTIKSASTVTIDGKKYTKLDLERVFSFFKAYKQQQLAAEDQANILKITTDKISFSSYIYYDQKNSSPATFTASLIYK
jgi:hypothetical protein